MKLSALFIAAAQAAPTSSHQWMVDNWWDTAVETFDYVNNNWAQFSGTVDGVSFQIKVTLRCCDFRENQKIEKTEKWKKF